MRDSEENNVYTNVYDQQVQNTHDFQNQHYIENELHLALDEDHSLVSIQNTNCIYQPVHTPVSTPGLIPHSNHDDVQLQEHENEPKIIEQENLNLQPIEQNHQHEVPVGHDLKVEYLDQDHQKIESTTEHNVINEEIQPQDDFNDDFTYDDESNNSFPSDRNNIENAIDKKIEEFIQNKRSKANPKICIVCNKLFRTNYKLRCHMETHSENSAKFQCNFENCNKTFKSKIGLNEHYSKHTGEYNFVCEVSDCQKKFLLRSYFLAHQKIHSEVKNFSCSLCPRKFKTKQNLINHENHHYGLKHFVCEIDSCKKSFTTKNNLDVHVRTSHSDGFQFKCDVCSKSFKTQAYLKVHRKLHFKELQNYACFCGKTFIQLGDLKIHSRTHSNERNFVCEV
jgi:KRAB domain-containing zinc finger protein